MAKVLELVKNVPQEIEITNQVKGRFGIQYKAAIEGEKEDVFLPTHLTRALFNKFLKENSFEVVMTEQGLAPSSENTFDGKPFKYDIKPVKKQPVINLNSYLTGQFKQIEE